jgi:hypothetical protein
MALFPKLSGTAGQVEFFALQKTPVNKSAKDGGFIQ